MDYSTTSQAPNPIASAIFFLIYIVIIVLLVIAGWKVFKKAGKPGWAFIIPIYNIIVLLEVIKRPIWWIILYLIPIANIIIAIIVALDLAKAFGKSGVFGFFLLFLLNPIGLLILGFGNSRYVYSATSKTAVQNNTPPSPPTPTA